MTHEPRKMNPARKTKPVQFYLAEEQWERLQALAAEDDRSGAWLLRKLVDDYLDGKTTPKPAKSWPNEPESAPEEAPKAPVAQKPAPEAQKSAPKTPQTPSKAPETAKSKPKSAPKARSSAKTKPETPSKAPETAPPKPKEVVAEEWTPNRSFSKKAQASGRRLLDRSE